MHKNDRDEEILQLIHHAGYMSIRDLAEKTYTSQSTIRRDLERLEQKGLIRRRHGGAESLILLRPPLMIRRQHNPAEKQAIARKAAALVTPGSTIFIDVSTTVQYMIPYLAGVDQLTVYTNGADTAMRLTASRSAPSAQAGSCSVNPWRMWGRWRRMRCGTPILTPCFSPARGSTTM